MGKEIKIGLGVIGVLLCVFGGVLFYRLRGEQPTKVEKVAAVKTSTKSKSSKAQTVNDEKSNDSRHDKSSGKTFWDPPQNAETQDEPAADAAEPPDLGNSPYRNRAAVDRYGRPVDLVQVDDSVLADDDADAESADEEQDSADEVAMPGDRFAQPAAGMDLSDDSDDEAPADDDADEPADAPRLSLDRRDRFAATRTATEVTGVEPADEEVAEEEDDSALSPDEPASDEPAVRPAADNRYARRRFETEPLDGGLSPQAEQMADADQPDEQTTDESQSSENPVQADSYIVEANDNFWRISQKVYGTGAYHRALEEYNRPRSGGRGLVNVGDAVAVPPIELLRERYPDLCPKAHSAPATADQLSRPASPPRRARANRIYTVVDGDTLFDIAREQLGKATRWADIYRLNRDQLGDDFNRLTPGMELRLPALGDDAEPVVTRPTRDSFRR